MLTFLSKYVRISVYLTGRMSLWGKKENGVTVETE